MLSQGKIAFILAVCLSLLVAAFAANAEQPPADNVEKPALSEANSRFFDEFLLASNAKLSGYSKVMIVAPEIAFDSRWERDNRRYLTNHYKDKTLAKYAKLLKEELSDAFADQETYTLVDEISDDALVVRASIPNLRINGPDWGPHVRQFVFHAGTATLEVDLKDSTGNTLAQFKDHRETRSRGFGFDRPERTSNVQNQQDFRFLMSRWSDKMVEHIAMN